jgi:AcrR family transcriptional regulator
VTARRSRVRLATVVRTLPHRGHGVARATVRDSQRWRLLEGMVEATARHGYAGASVAEVIAFAGVSRKAFYEHFTDKEDCFLAAYDVVSDRMIEQLVAAGAGHAPGLARRNAYIIGYLAALDRDLAVAHVFTVDVLGAGPRVLARRDAVNRRFADQLFGDSQLDEVRRLAVVGGVNTVVASELLRREPKLRSLGESLSAFVQAALRA